MISLDMPVTCSIQQRSRAAGNKAELQAKLEAARQTQGNLKAFIKQTDEEHWWSEVSDTDTLAQESENTPEERLYKTFRLEQRRQQMPRDGDQQRLYQMVEEEQQQVNPPSPAAAAEQQAIAAYAQSGQDFDFSELQDVIARFQAGDRSKVVQSVKKAPGKGQKSAGQQPGSQETDSHHQATEPAEPQDLSSYK